MDELPTPCLDPDTASEDTKKLYAKYIKGLRVLENNITEAETKSVTNSLKNACKSLNNSFEEQNKRRNTEEAIKRIEQRLLTVNENLATNEMSVAKLRTEYNDNQLSLRLTQANLEKLMATCRSLAIQSNQIHLENKKLEDGINKTRDHWSGATRQLSEIMFRMDSLISNSPKLNLRNQESRVVTEIQQKLKELQEQKDALIERQNFLKEQNRAEHIDFPRQVSDIAKTLLKIFSNVAKFKAHLADMQVLLDQEAERNAEQANIMDMSMAELDDTVVLLQATGGNGDYEEAEESTEADEQPTLPATTQEEVSAAKHQAVRNYVKEQAAAATVQHSESPSVQIIEPVVLTTPEDPKELETNNEEPVAQKNNTGHNPIGENFPQFDTGLSQDISNIDVNYDAADNVLNISMNSNDPGGDFLSMMASNGDKEKTTAGEDFSFSMFGGGDAATADGDSAFNFNFDDSGNAQESSFNFNFSTDNDTQSNNFFGFNF